MRVEKIGLATLYLGDCLEIMPTLDPVQLIVTDPPYELTDSDPASNNAGMSLGKFKGEEYRKIISGFDIDATFNAMSSICEPFNMFCFCSNKQISRIMAHHEKLNRSTNLVVWHKTNAAPFANGVWRGDIEYCVHAKSKGATFQGGAVEKKKVSESPAVLDKAHPTVKPLGIIQKYIRIGSNVGDTVADFFMGSGTTGIAAMREGRKFVGIEIDEKYFDIACHRIEQAQRQQKLF